MRNMPFLASILFSYRKKLLDVNIYNITNKIRNLFRVVLVIECRLLASTDQAKSSSSPLVFAKPTLMLAFKMASRTLVMYPFMYVMLDHVDGEVDGE